MADNLIELGLEIASTIPDEKNEKRYWVKILQTIGIILIFPLLGFLLSEIDFTDLIHNIGSSILLLIIISFFISFFAENGKIRKLFYDKGINRANGFISFIVTFLILSILIFNNIMPFTKAKQERIEKLEKDRIEKSKLKASEIKTNKLELPKIRLPH